MSDTLRFILSLSIVFAVVIGIVRFRKIDRAYYPFIYYISLMLLVEIIVKLLMNNGLSNALIVFLNLYTLAEFSLLTWLFHAWGLFNRNKTIFVSVLGAFVVAWGVVTLFIENVFTPNYLFRILYSFALVFFSVSTFNKMVVHHRGRIFRNAQFWICLGIIIFFTFFLLDCSTKLTLLGLTTSKVFRANLQKIIVFSNLLVNILYAVAVIWIPRKKNFMTRFSL